jgi:hypothetical protein
VLNPLLYTAGVVLHSFTLRLLGCVDCEYIKATYIRMPHTLLCGIRTVLSPFNSTHAAHQPWAGSVSESQCILFDRRYSYIHKLTVKGVEKNKLHAHSNPFMLCVSLKCGKKISRGQI